MKQVLIKSGQAVVEDIPAPEVEYGTVLVRTESSCISAGTEMSGIRTSAAPLWKRAMARPAHVKRAIELVATLGVTNTMNLIKGKLQAGQATGYSTAGIVMEVGEGVLDLHPGDRVACAGAQSAHHAEIVRVPRNLVVKIPDSVDSARASTVTLGAIALQGVRRASPTIGESFVVIGLGILGQLTWQMLRANGCRVIGVDNDLERLELARKNGIDHVVHPDQGENLEQVMKLTDGIGADGVIITAATPSDEVVSTAFRMCRKKGRVVLVGDVGLHLNRADFYEKELDFFISSSYGPGRYDRNYEELGMEYPVGYVRWTENRNMGEYLRLVEEGRIRLEPLISAEFPVEKAGEAYDALKNQKPRPVIVLLSYPKPAEPSAPVRVIVNPTGLKRGREFIRLAVVGVGGFAKSMHLPNLQKLRNVFHLRAVVSRTGHNAVAVTKQYGAEYSATDYQKVLDDPEVDAVLLCTRHNLHASMTAAALKAGKHVLVEKPLALDQTELDQIITFYGQQIDGPVLLTGFNRRFSPYAEKIAGILKNRKSPMILNYRMNAGRLPANHWVHGPEGGGRNIGEACHIYDLLTYLTGSRARLVQTHPVRTEGFYTGYDNFSVTISFEDGSVGNVIYTSLGSNEYPKEHLEVYADGAVISMTDYKQMSVFGLKNKGLETQIPDKGHKTELERFAESIRTGEWAIPLWQQVQATEISLAVEAELRRHKA